jgi:Reverse transcriptase (RNA-dependent DNA polymerase)
VLPGTSTDRALWVTSAAITLSRLTKSPLILFSEDKSKAFDSVPFEALRLSFSRFRIPSEFTEFYFQNFLYGRKVKLLTDFGPTPEIHLSREIPQGAIVSPLLWLLFYTPLLIALKTTPREFK